MDDSCSGKRGQTSNPHKRTCQVSAFCLFVFQFFLNHRVGDRAVFRSLERRKPSDQSRRTDAEVNESIITQCKDMSPGCKTRAIASEEFRIGQLSLCLMG